MPSSVEAYVFDLGNVIVDIHIENFLPALGLDGKWSVEEALEKYERSGLSNEFELGNILFDEFHDRSCELFGIRIDKGTFLEGWNAIIGEEKPGIYDIIDACSKQAPVYLLSNTNDPHYKDALTKAPSLRLMKEHYLSYELNLLKPDPRIYTETAGLIGLSPDRLFFTDDREDNIASAQEVGLQAVRFESTRQLKTILRL